ncbi:hypothetical protein UFOVP909_139 [uncultured Caudovirales phage]|uniref:Uncharacterized protein n=1 Tax=uncultured Caudovirales phage TaxID=2100421 RepID=A0A6J5QCK9_9CAUD|nr:hypothetical protein UFOVP909_139 [uncultured Caudovirales phage]CAB4182079.1 hypothetical protein UFOVP1066_132 [uncultured Caudovirales phage]CAB4198671.1 hypothetical protein UFOVP1315_205 [uncultured Caudovirales phage]CAB4211559.1 hypothetical protein UFOVP1421_166 [uncultured Caudovirales phage]CAB5238672.1 hypothetical protein UFOVP1525_176 [uncultured Caudovirales phage]
MITIKEAIHSLRPTAEWVLRGSEIEWTAVINDAGLPTGELETLNFDWLSDPADKPSKEELEAELIRLQAQWEANQYQRDRKYKYPPLADLADAIYWQAEGDNTKMTAYLAAVDAVKVKYPKG